ncbi:MAG TPA: hypothetical protein VGH21_05070 [Solirubrobacteraceae bacterium]|jgi:hypothetical protein
MIRSEVQRTLVKSPPELWAEISDPESLARHLGEFGEIRITRVQPEQKIEWEAAEASGTVLIKPSGWGTKVKLTVERELAVAEADAESILVQEAGADAEAAQEATAEPEALETELDAEAQTPIALDDNLAAERELQPATLDAEAEDDLPPAEHATHAEHAAHEEERELDLEAVAGEADPDVEAEAFEDPDPEPRPRRGFLARLFGRRRARAPEPRSASAEPQLTNLSESPGEETFEQPASEQLVPQQSLPADQPEALPADELDDEPEPAHEAEPEEPETASGPSLEDEPQAAAARVDEDAELIAAELEAAEAVAAEQVTAVLTGVLDSLGSAHHRPFSRA